MFKTFGEHLGEPQSLMMAAFALEIKSQMHKAEKDKQETAGTYLEGVWGQGFHRARPGDRAQTVDRCERGHPLFTIWSQKSEKYN